MNSLQYPLQILSAPSILGLRPDGTELLGKALLNAGLAEALHHHLPILEAPAPNALHNPTRDLFSGCLNTVLLRDYSIELGQSITDIVSQQKFALVLGGDCSILIGIMQALKRNGSAGLVFIDAHADFYEPEKSVTGEVADMDLAIVTGRGPELLTNIDGLRPYVRDEDVVHIGQRDQEETKQYGSQDILDSGITCYSLEDIQAKGIDTVIDQTILHIEQSGLDRFWIHFDTDVLDDAINPAVAYRLPGGLSFAQVQQTIRNLLLTQKAAGMSVTVFNPAMDKDGTIARGIVQCIAGAFN
jgi:arginase